MKMLHLHSSPSYFITYINTFSETIPSPVNPFVGSYIKRSDTTIMSREHCIRKTTYVGDIYASYSRARLNIKFLLLLLTMSQRQSDLRKHIGIKRKRPSTVRSNLNMTNDPD